MSDAAAAYPPARRHGSLVFSSGHVGADADDRPAGPDMATQARVALESLGRALADEGSSLAGVIRVEAFIDGREHFAEWDAAFRACFPVSPPARTTVVAAPPVEGLLIELQATAVAFGQAGRGRA